MLSDEALTKKAKKRDQEEGIYTKTDEDYKTEVRNKAMALRALKTTKHKAVIRDLRRKYLYKEDAYPKDLTEAQEMLNHYVLSNGIVEGKQSARKPKNEGAPRNTMIRGTQYFQEDTKGKSLVA